MKEFQIACYWPKTIFIHNRKKTCSLIPQLQVDNHNLLKLSDENMADA